MTSHSPRLLALLALTLPACGTDDGASDTSGSTGATTADTAADTTGTTSEPSTTEPTTDPTGGASTSSSTSTGDSTTTDTTTDTTTGALADCGFDPGLAFTRDALVWQLQSDDAATCVWLERRNDSEPDTIYKAVPYTLLDWRAGHDGEVAEVSDLARLTWESTHHNWMDVATATTATVVYRLEDWYPLEPVDEAFVDKFGLYAFDAATDAMLWGPITLHPYKP